MNQPWLSKQKLPSYVIENVEMWSDSSLTSNVSVVVENGCFAAGLSSPEQSSLPKIDGQGLVLMPAGVDAQTHLRVPGQAHKETPETGLLAALRGGYAALLTMPNTQPTLDSVEVLLRGQSEVLPFEQEFGVQVFWSAAITKKLNSNDLTGFEALVEAGVRAFTNDGLGVESDEVMEQAFARLEKLPVPLLQHAEFAGHGGCLAPGPIQRRVGASPYPDEPEWKMVERDLRILRRYPKARYHVLHVSSRRTLEFVRSAKREGLRVTAEVSPHHLFFNTETIDPKNLAFKMNPPIRSPEDQQALWAALSDGTLDFVATDHAPHEELMKSGEFNKAAFGTLGLETTLSVLAHGLRKGFLTPQRLVQVFATAPAQFLNVSGGLGRFEKGKPFHGVLFDPLAAERVYSADSIASLSKNSCFIGARLPGRILKAFHGASVFTFK